MPKPAYYVGTPVYTSDFTQGVSDWNLSTSSGASASKQNTANNLVVKINSTGTENWHIQLVKSNISLEAGKKYRVTFVAKADAQRPITAYVGQSVSPWSAYSGYNGITLDTEMNEYTYVFDMKTDDNAARLVFDLGQTADDLTFKSIILEEVTLQFPSSAIEPMHHKSTIFPNPVNDILMVENSDHYDEICIHNMLGVKMLEKNLDQFQTQVDLRNLTSGIYFVSLQNQKNRFTTKIIKN
jgi:hypothetical protein